MVFLPLVVNQKKQQSKSPDGMKKELVPSDDKKAKHVRRNLILKFYSYMGKMREMPLRE
jgi:hypothetical protein